jgi:hypothetical protein
MLWRNPNPTGLRKLGVCALCSGKQRQQQIFFLLLLTLLPSSSLYQLNTTFSLTSSRNPPTFSDQTDLRVRVSAAAAAAKSGADSQGRAAGLGSSDYGGLRARSECDKLLRQLEGWTCLWRSAAFLPPRAGQLGRGQSVDMNNMG